MSKCYASAVLAIAAAEIGYHEKKSNSQLDNPAANAGSAATSSGTIAPLPSRSIIRMASGAAVNTASNCR